MRECILIVAFLLSILGKPVTLEINQKTSASMYSMTADLSVGLAEIVECVFDRKGAPSSLLGVPIDKTVPDYCEVRLKIFNTCFKILDGRSSRVNFKRIFSVARREILLPNRWLFKFCDFCSIGIASKVD